MRSSTTIWRCLMMTAILVMGSVAATACWRLGSRPSGNKEQLRALEVTYLRAAVTPRIIDESGLEIAAVEQLQIAEKDGRRCLGLRVFTGQPLKNGGVRAEISVDAPYHIGDTVEYEWSFFIPDNFPSDAPRNRWWVLADWHDQPDRSLGETWDGFPARSAPIILGYGQVDGQDLIGLSYGSPDPLPVTTFAVQRGRWHAILVRVTWARDATGRVAIHLDGSAKPVAEASGPNMHNDFQHYAKIGMYRHPGIVGDNWIYIAGVDVRNLASGGGDR